MAASVPDALARLASGPRLVLSLRTCLIGCLAAACGPTAPLVTATDADGSSMSTGEPAGVTTSTATATTTATSTATSLAPTTDAVGSSGEATSGFVAEPDMGVGFIIPHDGPICSVGPRGELRCTECNTWTQDCKEGEKCSPYSSDGDNAWDALKCVPLDPSPDHAGEPCTVEGSGVSGVDSCDLESMCWQVDEDTLTGLCVPFCDGSPEAPVCPPDTACTITNDGAVTICLPSCDPLQQDCPAGELCTFVPTNPSHFTCAPDASGEEGQVFDPCSFVNVCDPGLFCSPPEHAVECDPASDGCCLPFCDLGLPPSCPGAMQQCLPWFEEEPAPAGLEGLGGCGLPP